MILYNLPLLLFGVICFGQFVFASLKTNPYNHDQVVDKNDETVNQKKFQVQSERQNTTLSEIDQYLEHPFYEVMYSQIFDWKDIQDGNVSKTSYHDDSPPFDYIDIDEHGGWSFPFYGHVHKGIYIEPNGFLTLLPKYCETHGFCNWDTSELNVYNRYIAPMMSDFDPTHFRISRIFYKFDHEKKRFIVQWNNITLYELSGATLEKDGFVFQAIIEKSGNIIFNYDTIPYFPGDHTRKFTSGESRGQVKNYPVTIGLEDSVIVKESNDIEVMVNYHPLNLNWSKIQEIYKMGKGVSVKFKPLLGCLQYRSCSTCARNSLISINNTVRMKCGWCEKSKICADRIGRETTSLSQSCLVTNNFLTTESQCALIPKSNDNNISLKEEELSDGYIALLVISFILVICVIIILACKLRMAKVTLEKFAEGVPDDADDEVSIPGMKEGKADYEEEEMSA